MKNTKIKKFTVPYLCKKKSKNKKIAMITAYDATFARLADDGGAHVVLVGDSLGMVVQGRQNTLEVTIEDMIYHCRNVSRGLKRAHLMCDMPFMSYKISREQALESAARLVREGRAESVKLEGGHKIADTISHIVEAGIPVAGHIGLTPQSVHTFGGFKMQGKDISGQKKLLSDAVAVEKAGAFCLILESIPMEVAKEITQKISIPTVGIGAGPYCDGQVLVIYDMLGMNEDFKPKFLKHYDDAGTKIKFAVQTYVKEVKNGQFPELRHSVSINDVREQNLHVIYGG